MRKGFTLIELLAVIVLLGVLSLIVISNVDKTIKEKKQQAYEIQIETIIDGAKMWASENVFDLPENDGEYVIVSLTTLKNLGFVKDDVTNPITNQQFDNILQVKITLQSNNYNYEIIE